MPTELHEAPAQFTNRFLPVSVTDPLNFLDLFGRSAPVEIDLGCGDGTFLTAWAAENPARNFLGIERLCSRLEKAHRKIARLALSNVRLLGIETSYAVTHLIPIESVSSFHLLFPDPWPKRRHHRRRIFARGFVRAVFRSLEESGLFHIATDDADYFSAMKRLLADAALFAVCEDTVPFPLTTFEQRFAERGVPIYRLLLRKVSPVR
jgi:tRNA (guanine-N(7)-)-methyltransferase